MTSEKCLEPTVSRLIEKIYGKPLAKIPEVPLPHRRGRIDIVYLYSDEPYVIAVELKLWDWRTGLRQALRNKSYAKYSFLAIQWKRRRRIKLNLFKEFGIGLIAVIDNSTADIVVEPRESERFERRKQLIIDYLKSIISKCGGLYV